MALETANEQQAEAWNAESGSIWVEHQERIDASIAAMGDRLLDRSDLKAGENVLDIGCGCGATTLEAARRVGGEGSAFGLDLSAPMLAHARSRAAKEGLTNIEFTQADAQIVELPPDRFDAAISRFGVMFFADPEAAFGNIARGLKPGGRLSFVCWRTAAENPWMTVPAMAAAQHIELPAPGDPTAPGPFAFADAERVRGILAAAGFDSIAIDPIDAEMNAGSGAELAETLEFLEKMGPLRAAMAAASEETREKARSAIRDAMKQYEKNGEVRMPQSAWYVSAKKPE